MPLTAFGDIGAIDGLISVSVEPDLDAITQNVRVIKDKVVNMGLIPATLTLNIAGIPVGTPLNFPIQFQGHTDFPGACPEDTVQETPLEVEGIFTQPGIEIFDLAGVELVEGVWVKIVLRTTITVTRPVIQDRFGHVCDVNPNRCENNTTPPSFTLPAPPENGGLLGGGGGV
ncbi:hypothetical protein SAMN05192559_10776 [Halobacillus karajensis]|uniref:hypothetical protein n=1 Tax=Halobacillus karajensis TaxID=195088 RepID=UPI0008A7E93E|nr:hypothetical protein [Halobacillus karajensis]SEI00931.1 hypothetical protein SAMN05192559_10776 [Halobacillus karajensis]